MIWERTKDDSSQRTALYCKRLFPREAGLASTDALQCIASHRRWHHFPGRFSGHHFLPKAASLPDSVGLATNDALQ